VNSLESTKVYVNPDESAVIECPHCGASGTRYVGRFKGTKRKVKIRCKCQSAFYVWFEFRKAKRKETDIQGYFTKLPDVDNWKKMLMTNVSVAGVGLLTHAMHDVAPGDQLKVKFTLNLKAAGIRALVEKEAVVRWVAEGNIGCEFREPAGYQNKYEHSPLHFYLMA
jgi:hypothetical protein